MELINWSLKIGHRNWIETMKITEHYCYGCRSRKSSLNRFIGVDLQVLVEVIDQDDLTKLSASTVVTETNGTL